jgi:hypothetical protein
MQERPTSVTMTQVFQLLLENVTETKLTQHPNSFIALAYQGKDIIVFRFIIEYSSSRDLGFRVFLRDFWPLGNNNNTAIFT